MDVKVEITPPTAIAPKAFPENTSTPTSISVQNSYSVESTTSALCPENIVKSQSTSPQPRKLSEIPQDSAGGSFLNPISGFARLNPSPPGTTSARLFKRIEEMIDLSSPYNHYRCLSPSETNLSQSANLTDSRIHSTSKQQSESGNKPGSSRLLRRQFSLDKDDALLASQQKLLNLETISSLVESAKFSSGFMGKGQYQPLLPVNQISKSNKQQSASLVQDLEKIEEIPVSPISASNYNNSASNIDNFNCLSNSKNGDSKEVSLNIDSIEFR